MSGVNFVYCSLAFFITALVIPLLIRISHKKGWYDQIDERKIHDGDIPRLGGVGIFFGFALTILAFILFNKRFRLNAKSVQFIVFIIGAITIHIVGLLDDFKSIRARYKAFIQCLIAIMLIAVDIRIDHVQIPFTKIYIDYLPLMCILSFIWFVGVFNTINLIDGLDGLSSVISGLAAVGLSWHFYRNGLYLYALISAMVYFSTLGFLVYNKPKAKIFMGDSGSLFLGYVLAVLPFMTMRSNSEPVLGISITILLIPITDTLFAMSRRIYRGIKFSVPDKEHLHHMLLDFDLSNKEILILIALINIFLITATIWFPSLLPIIWLLSLIGIYILHRCWKEKAKL